MERIITHNIAVAIQPISMLASIILKVPRKILPGHSAVVDLSLYG